MFRQGAPGDLNFVRGSLGTSGGNEQIARGWIIASRERLIVLCRVEEQSAPETRASATPRRGGGTAVPLSVETPPSCEVAIVARAASRAETPARRPTRELDIALDTLGALRI